MPVVRVNRFRARTGPLLSILLLCVAGPAPRAAEPDTPQNLEHQVKAAFLFNFAKFIVWPAAAFHDRDAPFVICVLRDAEFARSVDQAVQGKSVGERPFQVRRLTDAGDAASCQMLYLGTDGAARQDGLSRTMRDASVLTVGEARRSPRTGGIINFVMQDNRVHFEINPDAAERAGLRISSKLLQLATIVRDTSPAEEPR